MLLTINDDIFAFGDQVVRPARRPIWIADEKKVSGLRVVPVAPGHMVGRLTRSIKFERYDKKKADWVPTDCPRNLASIYLERMGLWGGCSEILSFKSCSQVIRDSESFLVCRGDRFRSAVMFRLSARCAARLLPPGPMCRLLQA